MQGGFGKMAPAVNGMTSEQLARLKSVIETGKPAARIAWASKFMRPFAHLLSVLLSLPGFFFASAFVALDHVSTHRGLPDFLFSLLQAATVLVPWLLLSLALVIAL